MNSIKPGTYSDKLDLTESHPLSSRRSDRTQQEWLVLGASNTFSFAYAYYYQLTDGAILFGKINFHGTLHPVNPHMWSCLIHDGDFEKRTNWSYEKGDGLCGQFLIKAMPENLLSVSNISVARRNGAALSDFIKDTLESNPLQLKNDL